MTIADMKAMHKEKGGHFFDRKTMRFFGTRIKSTLYKNGCFITSEYTNFDRVRRAYTMRYFDEKTGNVYTVKVYGVRGFNACTTLERAREIARSFNKETDSYCY